MGDGDVQPTDTDHSLIPFTQDERAEYEVWQNLGHRAWQMIDRWEAENEPAAVRGGGYGD